MGVEESRVDEPLGHPFYPCVYLHAFEASHVSELFLVRMAACYVRSPGRVEKTLGARFFLRGMGFSTNRVHKGFECRVDGCMIRSIAK
jgi:hypothetical protein